MGTVREIFKYNGALYKYIILQHRQIKPILLVKCIKYMANQNHPGTVHQIYMCMVQ